MELLFFENYDLDSVVSPVEVDTYHKLLQQSGYNPAETNFLVDGFRNGFDIGFRGNITGLRRTAPNLKFRIGNEIILWNKVMKEVHAKRYAGPYHDPPFKEFFQSPVGLVPKDNGQQTRLIFHLSFPRTGLSINSGTPQELCKVKYCDFADAIKKCMEVGITCKAGKSDMHSAFRNLGIRPSQFCLLLLKAKSPFDGKYYYFVDKCLPFGASISCSHFQRFSDSIAHLAQYRSGGNRPVNYLDDYLFAAYLKSLCNQLIQEFLDICKEINFPVSLDKTYWASSMLTFLGLLINLENQTVSIPADKVIRAKVLVEDILSSKKTTVRETSKVNRIPQFPV